MGKKRRRGSHKKNQDSGDNIATNGSSNDSQFNYKFRCRVQEDHRKVIYDCQFFENLKDRNSKIIATVGGPRVSIYKVESQGGMSLRQVYEDEDKEEEDFWTCAWTQNKEGVPFLAVAGKKGVIRIIGPKELGCVKTLEGHGRAVYHVFFNHRDPNILISTSRDKSIRMWNLERGFCVAVFGGKKGHKDEVLYADIHINETFMVSTGLDHFVKVWNLQNKDLVDKIRLSYDKSVSIPFPTSHQHHPQFSTNDVHFNYIDCGVWFGNLILSKSCDGNIVFWKAGTVTEKWDDIQFDTKQISKIRTLKIDDCEMWYNRFSLDLKKSILAVGNDIGKVYIYKLDVPHPNDIACRATLENPNSKSTIRRTALSNDGSILIYVCDDATIWRWDRVERRL